MRLAGALAWLATCGIATGGAAQSACLDTTAAGRDDLAALAGDLAPVLWFAQAEEYFPTLPFISAFDHEDNPRLAAGDFQGDGIVDFNDPSEIAPLLDDLDRGAFPSARYPGHRRLPLWDILADDYTIRPAGILEQDTGRATVPIAQRAPGQAPARGGRPPTADARTVYRPPAEKARLSAVFYCVRPLNAWERRDLWRYLRSDQQAWQRAGLDELFDADVDRAPPFWVVEYYFYYVTDRGLEGHPEDIEMVFIYVPRDREQRDRLRITVGTGHGGRVPNNVLVQTNRTSPIEAPQVLVELGGHASAPDLPPHGEFHPGVDANWHVDDLWGTRDNQATSGLGYLGQYDLWMTHPRDSARVVKLVPPRVVASWSEPRDSMAADLFFPYALVPLDVLQALYAALPRAGAPDSVAERARPQVRAWLERLHDSLAHAWAAHADHGLDLDREALRRMSLWNGDLLRSGDCGARWGRPPGREPDLPRDFRPAPCTVARDKHLIWTHENHRSRRTRVLKRHLFRPAGDLVFDWPHTGAGLLALVTYGFGVDPGEGFGVRIGAIVPVIRLPVQLPGFLTIDAGIYRPENASRPVSVSGSVLWERNYSRIVSWYARIRRTGHRSELAGDPDATAWTLGLGPSLLLRLVPREGWSALSNALRVRAGLRLDVRSWEPRFDAIGWELELSFRQ